MVERCEWARASLPERMRRRERVWRRAVSGVGSAEAVEEEEVDASDEDEAVVGLMGV